MKNSGLIVSIRRLFLHHLYDSTVIKWFLLTTFMTVSAGLRAYFNNKWSILSIYAKKQKTVFLTPVTFFGLYLYVKSRLIPHFVQIRHILSNQINQQWSSLLSVHVCQAKMTISCDDGEIFYVQSLGWNSRQKYSHYGKIFHIQSLGLKRV